MLLCIELLNRKVCWGMSVMCWVSLFLVSFCRSMLFSCMLLVFGLVSCSISDMSVDLFELVELISVMVCLGRCMICG